MLAMGFQLAKRRSPVHLVVGNCSSWMVYWPGEEVAIRVMTSEPTAHFVQVSVPVCPMRYRGGQRNSAAEGAATGMSVVVVAVAAAAPADEGAAGAPAAVVAILRRLG